MLCEREFTAQYPPEKLGIIAYAYIPILEGRNKNEEFTGHPIIELYIQGALVSKHKAQRVINTPVNLWPPKVHGAHYTKTEKSVKCKDIFFHFCLVSITVFNFSNLRILEIATTARPLIVS